jgi:c-di-GMP-binding flagellar brake protein YcgR
MFASTFAFWHWLTGQPEAAPTSVLDAPEADRRARTRHPLQLDIYCQPVGGEEATLAALADISQGGVKLIARRHFAPGTVLSVELRGSGGGSSLKVLACVVHTTPQDEGEWTMGCRFSAELSEEHLRAFGAARGKASDDSRNHPRSPCDTLASFRRVAAEDQGPRRARVLNIGAGGVALRVDEAVTVGELLSTELDDPSGRPVVNILACVVHVQPEGGEWLLGCNFIRELAEHDLRALLTVP